MKIGNLNGMVSENTINALGGIRKESDTAKFRDDLKVLLETKRGTLIGDPDFGSDLYTYLFLPATESTAQLIRDEVAYRIEERFINVKIVSIDVKFCLETIKLYIKYTLTGGTVGDTVTLEFIKGGE